MGRQLAQAIMVEGTDLVRTAIDPYRIHTSCSEALSPRDYAVGEGL